MRCLARQISIKNNLQLKALAPLKGQISKPLVHQPPQNTHRYPHGEPPLAHGSTSPLPLTAFEMAALRSLTREPRQATYQFSRKGQSPLGSFSSNSSILRPTTAGIFPSRNSAKLLYDHVSERSRLGIHQRTALPVPAQTVACTPAKLIEVVCIGTTGGPSPHRNGHTY